MNGTTLELLLQLRIKQAVDQGKADEDPNSLEKYIGDFVFNPANNTTAIPIGEPAEVLEIGTGFMMIRRETFKMYDNAYPEQSYKPVFLT